MQYTFTATPANGGTPVVVTSSTPDASFTGLKPSTQYTVKVTATRGDGSTTPASNTLTFVTPAAAGPAVEATPDTPTTADVLVTPPTGGPWDHYDLTLCPIGGGTCVTSTCNTAAPTACPVTGLEPETTYVTTVVAVKPDGTTKSPPSNEAIFTTPSEAPVLTSADATGPTAGHATATPPEGVTFTKVGGGSPGVHCSCTDQLMMQLFFSHHD